MGSSALRCYHWMRCVGTVYQASRSRAQLQESDV